MKSAMVAISVVIAIITATVLHNHKITNETDDIDKAAIAMKGAEQVLSPTANISIQPYGIPGEVWMYCRYALIPRHCGLYRPGVKGEEKADTVLAITNANATDSLMHAITENRKMLWQGSDQQYKYYLTCNNP